jgi:hypothetical protein
MLVEAFLGFGRIAARDSPLSFGGRREQARAETEDGQEGARVHGSSTLDSHQACSSAINATKSSSSTGLLTNELAHMS